MLIRALSVLYPSVLSVLSVRIRANPCSLCNYYVRIRANPCESVLSVLSVLLVGSRLSFVGGVRR